MGLCDWTRTSNSLSLGPGTSRVRDRTRGRALADQGPRPLVGAEKGLSGQGREGPGQRPSWVPNRLPSFLVLFPATDLFLHSHVHSFVHSFIPGISPERARESACGACGNSPTCPSPSTKQGGPTVRSPPLTLQVHAHALAHAGLHTPVHPPHSHTAGGDGLGPGRKYPINVYPVTHGAESRACGG